jgi:hypothetical protein
MEANHYRFGSEQRLLEIADRRRQLAIEIPRLLKELEHLQAEENAILIDRIRSGQAMPTPELSE